MNGTDVNYAEIIGENEITVGCSSEGRDPHFPSSVTNLFKEYEIMTYKLNC